MRHAALALLVALGGCSSPEPVTVAATLTCHARVSCDVVSWSVGLGVKDGPRVSGVHGGCRCADQVKEPP